jgi:hypothetical protein
MACDNNDGKEEEEEGSLEVKSEGCQQPPLITRPI